MFCELFEKMTVIFFTTRALRWPCGFRTRRREKEEGEAKWAKSKVPSSAVVSVGFCRQDAEVQQLQTQLKEAQLDLFETVKIATCDDLCISTVYLSSYIYVSLISRLKESRENLKWSCLEKAQVTLIHRSGSSQVANVTCSKKVRLE